MCDIALIGDFDKVTKRVFDEEKIINLRLGVEAEKFLLRRAVHLIVIKNQLDDGLAMGFLFKWLCMGDRIIRDNTKVILVDFDAPLPNDQQWERVKVLDFKDAKEKRKALRDIVDEINLDNSEDTAIYFLNRLEMVKAQVIRAKEALSTGMARL